MGGMPTRCIQKAQLEFGLNHYYKVNIMIELFGIKVTYEALAFFALFIGSEVIGSSKLKENSIVQVILRGIEAIKPHRTEDDKIQRIKDTFK